MKKQNTSACEYQELSSKKNNGHICHKHNFYEEKSVILYGAEDYASYWILFYIYDKLVFCFL